MEEFRLGSLIATNESGTLGAEDIPLLLSQMNSALRRIEGAVAFTNVHQLVLESEVRKLSPSDSSEDLSETEAEEIDEIYLRVDRELDAEEARADRLLRLYNL